MSPGAVYRYFPSKDHIIALIDAAKSQGASPLQTLDFIMDYGLQMLSGESFLEVSMMNVQVWSEATRSKEIRMRF